MCENRIIPVEEIYTFNIADKLCYIHRDLFFWVINDYMKKVGVIRQGMGDEISF